MQPDCPVGSVLGHSSQISLLVQVLFHFNWIHVSAICIQDKAEEGKTEEATPSARPPLTLVSYTVGIGGHVQPAARDSSECGPTQLLKAL